MPEFVVVETGDDDDGKFRGDAMHFPGGGFRVGIGQVHVEKDGVEGLPGVLEQVPGGAEAGGLNDVEGIFPSAVPEQLPDQASVCGKVLNEEHAGGRLGGRVHGARDGAPEREAPGLLG